MKLKRTLTMMLMCSALVACSKSKQADIEEYSGFLGQNYKLLEKGSKNEAQMVYRNKGVDVRRYDKILFEPVSLWGGKKSEISDLSAKDREYIANKAFSIFYQELSKDFEMVSAVSPGTLRIAIALTNAESSSATLDTVSTVLPQLLLVSALKDGITGKPSFVGEVAAEGKISDASTGELIAAGVDRRVGGKDLDGATSSWDDVEDALGHWAKNMRFGLCKEQKRPNCKPAEES